MAQGQKKVQTFSLALSNLFHLRIPAPSIKALDGSTSSETNWTVKCLWTPWHWCEDSSNAKQFCDSWWSENQSSNLAGQVEKIRNNGDRRWKRKVSCWSSLKCLLFLYRTWKGWGQAWRGRHMWAFKWCVQGLFSPQLWPHPYNSCLSPIVLTAGTLPSLFVSVLRKTETGMKRGKKRREKEDLNFFSDIYSTK